MVKKLLAAAYALLILAVVFPGGAELQRVRDGATFGLVLLFLANLVGFLLRGVLDDVVGLVRRTPPAAAEGSAAPDRPADEVAADADAMRRQFQAGRPAATYNDDPPK